MTSEDTARGGTRVWWLALLRPGLLNPMTLLSKRHSWLPAGGLGLAGFAADQVDGFLVRACLDGSHHGFRRFDWLGLFPFAALVAAEISVLVLFWPWGPVFVLVATPLVATLAEGAACMAAIRHARWLKSLGLLDQLRTLPASPTELEAVVLVWPAAVVGAGAVLLQGVGVLSLALILAQMAVGGGACLAPLLFLVAGPFCFATLGCALRSGLYAGWRAAIEAQRREEEMPGALAVYMRSMSWPIVRLLALAGLLAVVLALTPSLGVLKIVVHLVATVLPFGILAAQAKFWQDRASIADLAVERLEECGSIADVPEVTSRDAGPQA